MRNQGLPLFVNPTRRFRAKGGWSRVLQYPTWFDELGKHLNMIEFSITPRNGDHEYEWAEVAEVRIRKHGTAIEERDTFADVIPMGWYHMMSLRLGPELRDFMLYQKFNILEDFDWALYEKLCNGGVPLAAIYRGKIPERRIFK